MKNNGSSRPNSGGIGATRKKQPKTPVHPFASYDHDSLGRVIRPSCRHALVTSLIRNAHQLLLEDFDEQKERSNSVQRNVTTQSTMDAEGIPEEDTGFVYGGDSDGRYLHTVSARVDNMVRSVLAAIEDERRMGVLRRSSSSNATAATATEHGLHPDSKGPSTDNATTRQIITDALERQQQPQHNDDDEKEDGGNEEQQQQQTFFATTTIVPLLERDLRFFNALRCFTAFKHLYEGAATTSGPPIIVRLKNVLRAMEISERKLWQQQRHHHHHHHQEFTTGSEEKEKDVLHNNALHTLYSLFGIQQQHNHHRQQRLEGEQEPPVNKSMQLLVHFCMELAEDTTELPLAVMLSRLLLALSIAFFPGMHTEQTRALFVDPLVHRVCLFAEEQLLTSLSLDEVEAVLFLSGKDTYMQMQEEEQQQQQQQQQQLGSVTTPMPQQQKREQQQQHAQQALLSRTRYIKMRGALCRILTETFLFSLVSGVTDSLVLWVLVSNAVRRLTDAPPSLRWHSSATLGALLHEHDSLLIFPHAAAVGDGDGDDGTAATGEAAAVSAIHDTLLRSVTLHSGDFSISAYSFAQLLNTLLTVLGIQTEIGNPSRQRNAVNYTLLLPSEFTPPGVAFAMSGEEAAAGKEGSGEKEEATTPEKQEQKNTDEAQDALDSLLRSAVRFAGGARSKSPPTAASVPSQQRAEAEEEEGRSSPFEQDHYERGEHTTTAVHFSFSQDEQGPRRQQQQQRPLSSASTRTTNTLSGWDNGRRPGSAQSSGAATASSRNSYRSNSSNRATSAQQRTLMSANSSTLNFRSVLPTHIQRQLADRLDQTVEISRLLETAPPPRAPAVAAGKSLDRSQQQQQGKKQEKRMTTTVPLQRRTPALSKEKLRDRNFMDSAEAAQRMPAEIKSYMLRYETARSKTYEQIVYGKQREGKPKDDSESPLCTRTLRPTSAQQQQHQQQQKHVSAVVFGAPQFLQRQQQRQTETQKGTNDNTSEQVFSRSATSPEFRSSFASSDSSPSPFFATASPPYSHQRSEDDGGVGVGVVPALQRSKLSIAHESRSKDPGRLHRTRHSSQTSQFRLRDSKTVSQRALSSDKYVQLLNLMRLSPETHKTLPVSAKKLSLSPGTRSHRDLTPYFDLPTQWTKHHHPEWTTKEWKDYFNFVFFNDQVSDDDRRKLQAVYPHFQLPVRATGDLQETIKRPPSPSEHSFD